MKQNLSVPTLVQQLELLNRDLTKARRPKEAQHVEKQLMPLFDDVCAAYLQAVPEERVDLAVAFEFRGRMLAVMTTYFNNIARQALKAAKNRRQEKTAIELIRQGVAADMIVGPRVEESEVEEADANLIHAASEINFDMLSLVHELEIPVKIYVQRAIQYNKGKQRVKALKALGLALRANPQLEKNDKVAALATTLTGETPVSALITVSDGYVLKKFVESIETQSDAQTPLAGADRRSTMEIIRSWLS